MRQIILDTETTGMRVEEGHKIIEIGCLELVNRKLTQRQFHIYLNPGRDIDPGAQAVHGITSEFLKDKPIFRTIADDFIAFIQGAELIIHNAPFDVAFLNYELACLGKGYQTIADYCTVIDTLPMARQRHAGQRNSLDALCKRYGVDNSKREYHGALLDAFLLAQVYLAMTGGQGHFFDALADMASTTKFTNDVHQSEESLQHDADVFLADEQEQTAHQQYLDQLEKQGKCLWRVISKQSDVGTT
jgi:DNA polymerase-3 subunit epsilon